MICLKKIHSYPMVDLTVKCTPTDLSRSFSLKTCAVFPRDIPFPETYYSLHKTNTSISTVSGYFETGCKT